MSVLLSYDAVCFDLYGTLVDGDGRAYPGVAEALAALPRERWAIVTSCAGPLARALLRAAGIAEPATLVSSDDVEQTKPSGDPYALAAARLRVQPARALAVEDSREGLAAARAAGLDAIAILRGRGVRFAHDALFVAECFRDIRWSVRENGSIGFTIEP